MSEREWEKRLRQALRYVVEFLRDEEIMTVPDWVNPSDRTATTNRGMAKNIRSRKRRSP